MDYFSHTRNAAALLEKLARTQPRTLACMHGSAWRGDGASLLRELAAVLDPEPAASRPGPGMPQARADFQRPS